MNSQQSNSVIYYFCWMQSVVMTCFLECFEIFHSDFIFLKSLSVEIIWVLLCKVYSSRKDYYYFFNLPCVCLEFISNLPYNVTLVTEVLEIQFLGVNFQTKNSFYLVSEPRTAFLQWSPIGDRLIDNYLYSGRIIL